MAAEDCSKVALEAGLKKVKVYVKDQETDVSLLSFFA
jgi:ribosomal protein S11